MKPIVILKIALFIAVVAIIVSYWDKLPWWFILVLLVAVSLLTALWLFGFLGCLLRGIGLKKTGKEGPDDPYRNRGEHIPGNLVETPPRRQTRKDCV
jgi:RsiW-degrading membrane proteinase PrsW (M82 family)